MSPAIVACAGALLASAGHAEPAVIGLARAYLGPDTALDGIASIHLVGNLERVDPDHADKGPIRGTIDLIFVKPLRQRQVVRMPEATETTVLDGYDAWDILQDNAEPAKHVLTWLGADDIRAIRASTWENLYFYRVRKGEVVVEDKGLVTTEGVACERVDFIHGPGIVYERCFDRDTGRLVSTSRGLETIRESGEIRADGVRFPKTIVSVRKTASGKDLVSTVIFDTVTLNEPVEPGVFSIPSLLPSKAVKAAAGPQVK